MSFLDKLNPFKLSPEAQARLDEYEARLGEATKVSIEQSKKRASEAYEKGQEGKVENIKAKAFQEIPKVLENAISEIQEIEKVSDNEKFNSSYCNSQIKPQILILKNNINNIISEIELYGEVDEELKQFLQESYQRLLEVTEQKRKELGIEDKEKAQ